MAAAFRGLAVLSACIACAGVAFANDVTYVATPRPRPPTARPLPTLRPPAPTAHPHTPAPTPRPRGTPAPQILAIALAPRTVSGGTLVAADVTTTREVVSVIARVPAAQLSLRKIGPGRFTGSTRLPWLPWFVHGTYDVTFVARAASGAWTQSAVAVTVR